MLTFVALLAGRLRADQDSAQKALEAKGLKRAVSNFALPEEADFTKQLKAMEALKKKVVDAQHEAENASRKVDDKKTAIVTYLQKRRELRVQLEAARTPDVHNKIVDALNELGDRVALLQQSETEEKAMAAARATANKATEEYVQQLLNLRQLYDKVEAKYDALDADAAVTQAIDEFNKDSAKKFALGPTSGFLSAGRKLKKLEEIVLSESIKIRAGEGGLWYVSVFFNGKYTEEMSVDTGSSVIALPAKVATEVGLTPASDAPTVELQLADGHVVQGKQVYADTVRVGKFEAKHVECAVLPPELPNASALLGMSYLRNFIFKLDAEKGHLVMSKIDAPEKTPPTGRPKHGRKTGGE